MILSIVSKHFDGEFFNTSNINNSGAMVTFHPKIILTRVYPEIDTSSGGTKITVFGGPFFSNTSLLKCSFSLEKERFLVTAMVSY